MRNSGACYEKAVQMRVSSTEESFPLPGCTGRPKQNKGEVRAHEHGQRRVEWRRIRWYARGGIKHAAGSVVGCGRIHVSLGCGSCAAVWDRRQELAVPRELHKSAAIRLARSCCGGGESEARQS